MKRIMLMVCIAINIALFLAGCGYYGNSTSTAETRNTSLGHELTEPVEKTDWKATTIKTVNNLDSVDMSAEKGTVSSTGLNLYFKNNSSLDYIFGDYFCLEKRIEGCWYQVPIVVEGNYAFNDIGYPLASGDDSELTVDWEWLYGSLGKGDYRIIKDISLDDPTSIKGIADKFYLSVRFKISE